MSIVFQGVCSRSLPGCEWWQESFWASSLRVRVQRPAKPKRCILHEAFCAGAMTEAMAMKGADIPFRSLSASDRKPLSRKFLAAGTSVEHIFADIAEQALGEGHCYIHGRRCKLVETPDFACGGLPCQPFSKMWRRNGKSPKEGDAKSHPGFQVIDQTFQRYLVGRRPKSFLVEESVGMQAIDPLTGESFLQAFIDACAELGYAVRALLIDHLLWCEQPRDRPHVRQYSPEVGRCFLGGGAWGRVSGCLGGLSQLFYRARHALVLTGCGSSALVTSSGTATQPIG